VPALLLPRRKVESPAMAAAEDRFVPVATH
jgi:hypothetical protein